MPYELAVIPTPKSPATNTRLRIRTTVNRWVRAVAGALESKDWPKPIGIDSVGPLCPGQRVAATLTVLEWSCRLRPAVGGARLLEQRPVMPREWSAEVRAALDQWAEQ